MICVKFSDEIFLLFWLNYREEWIVLRSYAAFQSTSDFKVHVIDIDTQKVVRVFSGHRGRITDMVRICAFMMNVFDGVAPFNQIIEVA